MLMVKYRMAAGTTPAKLRVLAHSNSVFELASAQTKRIDTSGFYIEAGLLFGRRFEGFLTPLIEAQIPPLRLRFRTRAG